MTHQGAAMATLLELAVKGASGEFVCVSSHSELHVYFQSGRIAWATDSTRPFAFSRYLLEHTSITKDVFTEVLESCRQDRLPLGETLIDWKVATLEEIRAALHHQVVGALATLALCMKERTIFLERHRQYASYDTRLTFDVAELLEAQTSAHRIPKQGNVPSKGVGVASVVELVRGAIPAPAWLALVDGDRVIEQQPAQLRTLVPREILDYTVLDGADLAALRTGRGTVVGVALPEVNRSVWCRLHVETAFGSTLSALCNVAGIEQTSTPRPPHVEGWGTGTTIRAIGDSDRSGFSDIRIFMERAPEIDGVLVVENGDPIGGALRRRIDEEWMKDIARRRAPLLGVTLAESAEDVDIEDLGYRLNSVVTGEDQMWCFGAELASESRRTLWIFVGRDTAQGLGWAYLTSLSRQLASLGAETAAAK